MDTNSPILILTQYHQWSVEKYNKKQSGSFQNTQLTLTLMTGSCPAIPASHSRDHREIKNKAGENAKLSIPKTTSRFSEEQRRKKPKWKTSEAIAAAAEEWQSLFLE